MGTSKKFTEEEIQTLAKNPHTLSVTENRISFTLEAKRTILEQYGAGKSMRQVIKDLGYDPDVLGKGRLKSIAKNIQAESESEHGLHEGYVRTAKRKRLSTEEIKDLETDEASIIKLKNEVVYLRAEMEFLKKSHNRRYPGSEASSDGRAGFGICDYPRVTE